MKMERKALLFLSLFVIPLYTAQGWLFDSGSIISQGLILFWLIVNIYYTLDFLFQGNKTSISTPLLLLLLYIFLTWLLSPKIVHANYGWTLSTWGDLKNIAVVFLSYFSFRRLMLSGTFKFKQQLLFLLLMILSSVVAFFLINKKFDADLLTITNNTGYYFAMLMPLMCIVINKKYGIFLFAILLYFCIGSAKRGAIGCFLICAFYFFFYSMKYNPIKKRNNQIIKIAVFLLIILWFAHYLYIDNFYLQARVERSIYENDLSGRDIIYAKLVDTYMNGDLFALIFGHGMNKTIEIAGIFAHQDWLELLINHGLVGLLLYLWLFLSMATFFNRNKKYLSYVEKYLFVSTLSCWLIKSFVSMGYTHFFSFIFLAEYALFECKVVENKKRYKLNKL